MPHGLQEKNYIPLPYKMKFLADMGIPNSTVHFLQQFGHDTVHIRGVGMKCALDVEIVAKARNEERIVLTCARFRGYSGRLWR